MDGIFIYCVVWNDRHADIGVRVFQEKDEAIKEARRAVESIGQQGEDITENHTCYDDGQCFSIIYSYGEDSIAVFKLEVGRGF